MKKIKEEDLENKINFLKGKTLKLKLNGDIKIEYCIEKAEIIFLNDIMELNIKDEKNNITINLSYIEEIFLVQKNKLKFLTDKKVEILICIL